MKFIGFTYLRNSETALCSLAYIKSPGYSKIDSSFVHFHDCRDHDINDYPENVYPKNARSLNPPPVNYTEFAKRLRYPQWKVDEDKSGSIFPVDLRSKLTNKTTPYNKDSPTFIEFNTTTTFNGIRTTYNRVPYLLQSKDSYPRCDENSLLQPNNYNFTSYTASDDNLIRNSTITICPHVISFPLNPADPWAEMILINSGYNTAHPIHQHGGVMGQLI